MQKLDNYLEFQKKFKNYRKKMIGIFLIFFGITFLIDSPQAWNIGIFLIGITCSWIYYDRKVANVDAINIEKKLFQIKKWFDELDYKKRLEIYEKYK